MPNAYFMRHSVAVFPIGVVRANGDNKLVDNVFKTWSSFHIVLLKKIDGQAFKAIFATGSAKEGIGSEMWLRHDQTLRDLGEWKVVANYRGAPDGLRDLLKRIGKPNIAGCVYK